MSLTRLAEDLWCDEHDLRLAPALYFRGRMTVVRLPSGELLLVSPVPIDDALASELAALGPVTHVVAPNQFHHVHLTQVIARYPQARVYGAPGLDAKRPDVTFDQILGDEAPGAWGDALACRVIGGVPKVMEVVLLHKPSRSLIVTDLVLNVRQPRGWLTHVFLWMAGVHKRFGQSRLWRLIMKDRPTAVDALEHVLAWDFERVIMAHGEIVESTSGAELRSALGWVMALKPQGGKTGT